jgi:hypothetical protein
MLNTSMAVRPGKRPTPSPKTPDRTTKQMAILSLFVGGARLNRFEAEAHHDHCLHSTVSALEGLGIVIARKWESVPCLGGQALCRCKRYWLDMTPENVAAARALLGERFPS